MPPDGLYYRTTTTCYVRVETDSTTTTVPHATYDYVIPLTDERDDQAGMPPEDLYVAERPSFPWIDPPPVLSASRRRPPQKPSTYG